MRRISPVLKCGVEITRYNSEYVAAVVMLATVGNAPRIKELLDIAKETKEDVIKSKEKKTSMFEEGIDPLFE